MEQKKDLVVVTIDCMRADFFNEESVPNLSGFGRSATVYTSAYANGCGTPDSFPSIFASRHAAPFAHKPQFDADIEYALRTDDLTLAEVLHDADYETAAFVGGNPYLGSRYGYNRGFDTFEDNQPGALVDRLTGGRMRGALRKMARHIPLSPYPRADKITRQALGWLAKQTKARSDRRPFFLWVHYMDAHFPTLPPGRHGVRERQAAWSPIKGESDKHHDLLVGLYRDALSFIDREVSKLITRTPADATIAITSDHGQLFGEHDSYWHNGVWEPLVRVPLIVAGPDVPSGVSPDLVQLLDLAPHLLGLLDVEPPARWQGDSLRVPSGPIYAVSNNPGQRTYTEATITPTQKTITSPAGTWQIDRVSEPSDMDLKLTA